MNNESKLKKLLCQVWVAEGSAFGKGADGASAKRITADGPASKDQREYGNEESRGIE